MFHFGKLLKCLLCAVIALASTVLVASAAAPPFPAMSGPLNPNEDPADVDAGSLGEIDITGAVSGIALVQTSPSPGDRSSGADIGNAQVFVQNTTGLLQFFAQLGVYTLPSLGTPFLSADNTVRETYGFAPVAFLKFAPEENFSIEAGKLPSLIGNEATFTFENFNIERGLLWNQTSSVSRGVQLNYTQGPLALSASWNDGYYSGRFNWLTGSISYSLSGDVGSVALVGGANLGHTAYSSFATPLAQNNSAIGNVVYNVTIGRWTFSPYLQASHIAANGAAGLEKDASTIGAAMLASCKLNDDWSVAIRGESVHAQGGLNVLYGPDSSAWSLTLTPAYQKGVFFARAEASYVGIANGKPGLGLGRNLDSNAQARLMLETGVLF
jgi:hypothetical protein